MFSDRRMILGALVVLIGLLLFALVSPLSPFSRAKQAIYEEVEAHAEAHEHERHEDARSTRTHNADYEYAEVIEKTFKVRSGQTLRLATDFGKVAVRGNGGNEVVLRVIKGADDMSEREAEALFERFELDFDQNADGVTIEGDYDGERRGRMPLKVEYEIAVPHEFHVQVKTAGGGITAEDLQGAVDLRTSGGSVTTLAIDGPLSVNTSGGSIKAETIGGPASLHTSGGSITAREINGPADVNTSGGSITIEVAHGPVEARTSGGSIRLNEIHGTADAHTSGGSITADLAVVPNGPMKLDTSGGSVTLRLTEETSIDVDAHASGGTVRTDMPVQVEGELSRSQLRGKINGGGPLVTLRSSGGGVRILKR